MPSLLTYLSPWEFSPLVLMTCVGAGILFWLGMRANKRAGQATGFWRTLSFYFGLALVYAVMQTYVDYLSQHMFWVHRLQHLVLHHLAPLLIALSYPHEILARGLPDSWRKQFLLPLWNSLPIRTSYAFVQNPFVAPILFVGLIYFWLLPSVHFDAMLSSTRYQIMNWSMLLDGLLFWWLIVDNRSPLQHRTLRYPVRVLILFVVNIAQVLIGAHIALAHEVLYNVYSVCGRAWPINPLTDQQIGGLITWIPSAMMGAVGFLIVIRLWMRNNSMQAEVGNELATEK